VVGRGHAAQQPAAPPTWTLVPLGAATFAGAAALPPIWWRGPWLAGVAGIVVASFILEPPVRGALG
jgi:hypothetical protein